jgi:[protein-PII] uridylyltransferase
VADLRRALAADFDHEGLDAFLARMPAGYLLAQTSDQVAAHLRLLHGAADGPVRTRWTRAVDGVHDELTLIAEDRPGLLWRVCGVFALHGVSILEARVYTDRDGTAIDVFRLDDSFEPAIGEDKRSRIERDVAAVLEGRLSLGYRLARKLRSYRDLERGPSVASSVSVDNAASERYTLVEVRARDRLGLLYSIARAMSDLQLDIHLAKLATRGSEAIDVFYVRDAHGRKATDPDFAREVERAILYELESLG